MSSRSHFVVVPLLAGALTAQGFQCDFQPTTREVILNTDRTVIATGNCPPVTVVGGVFLFRSVRIPPGVIVRGVGSRPLIFIVAGDFVVDGEIVADGGPGARVDFLNSANVRVPGGIGVCGGGAGGDGSPRNTASSVTGETGFGPGNGAGSGGGGGRLSCPGPDFGRGSGGGGGSFATAGDPYYKLKNVGTSLVQQLGRGGLGGQLRTLGGGAPGSSVLSDGIVDNDFYGVGFDLARRRLVIGELPGLFGGAGGGGGGDLSAACPNNPFWINDASGGGGGGGGGALLVLAGGRIVLGAQGRITCSGGNGGGGEQAGTNNQGGGGGGGSGGMVALYSYTYIEIQAHGETYANNDYDFAIAADGGVGAQGPFSGFAIEGKYPPPRTAQAFDLYGAGGFGGLGVIQLATLVDGSNRDGTNTIFDDNVHIVQNGVRLSGAAKQRYLAWRGYLDANGVRVDDHGLPTNIGDNEGDLRPSPTLLPLFR